MPKRKPLQVGGQFWLSGADGAAGAGRIALLQAIDAHGSISAAAREIGMSYKAAWDAVDTMNNLAGKPLVLRETGGKGGGGTRLTDEGHALIAAFGVIRQAHDRFVADATRALSGSGVVERGSGVVDSLSLIRRLSMKTSARNQFHGSVKKIHRGAVNDEIELALVGGTSLFATITQESTSELALKKGSDVVALVKAPWVILATGTDLRVSTRNRLPGTVARITQGAVNAEVSVVLAGGGTLIAIVTNESVAELELAEGVAVTSLINASHVILAVPA